MAKPNGALKDFLVSLAIAGLLIAGLFIYFWLSSKSEKRQERNRQSRLDEALAVCTNNEDSSTCKNLQSKYSITFKYCKSTLDSVEDQYKFVKLSDGTTTIVANPIWHAVAWEGTNSEPPKEMGFRFYYDCSYHIE